MFSTSLLLTALLQAATLPAAAAADPNQEVKCRRVEVTGSIVRKERVCKTKAEWQRVNEHGNSFARALVDQSRSGAFDQ